MYPPELPQLSQMLGRSKVQFVQHALPVAQSNFFPEGVHLSRERAELSPLPEIWVKMADARAHYDRNGAQTV